MNCQIANLWSNGKNSRTLGTIIKKTIFFKIVFPAFIKFEEICKARSEPYSSRLTFKNF